MTNVLEMPVHFVFFGVYHCTRHIAVLWDGKRTATRRQYSTRLQLCLTSGDVYNFTISDDRGKTSWDNYIKVLVPFHRIGACSAHELQSYADGFVALVTEDSPKLE
jgi:hypothetical protein